MVAIIYGQHASLLGIPIGDMVMSGSKVGHRYAELDGGMGAADPAIRTERVGAQQPEQCLHRVAAGKDCNSIAVDADRSVQVAPLEARPVYQREKPSQGSLSAPHAGRQRMRLAVRPAHATAGGARGEMGPLHMPEIFIVERVRQCHTMVFEGMDR